MTAKCPTCNGTGQDPKAPKCPFSLDQIAGMESWALEKANRLFPARWPETPPVIPTPPKAKAPPVAPDVTPVPVSCGIAPNPAPVPPAPAKPAKRTKGVSSHGLVPPAPEEQPFVPLPPFEREQPPWDLPPTPPSGPPAVIAQESIPIPAPVPGVSPGRQRVRGRGLLAVKEAWAWTPDVFDALRDGFVLPRDANTKQIQALLDLSPFRPGDPLEWIAAWCLTYRTIRNASVGQRVLAESAAYEATVVWCQHYPLEAERLRTRAKDKEALAQLGLGLKVVKP